MMLLIIYTNMLMGTN